MSRETEDPIHPIGIAAGRAGITPDVIRAWERRYGVVEPERDEAGRRVYTSADITRLSLLARATAGGRSIGQVVELDDPSLRELIRQDEASLSHAVPREAARDAEETVEAALDTVDALDAGGLEALLVRDAARRGLPALLRTVVAPLFRAIGEAWHGGRLSAAQEHLATVTVRGVLTRLLGNIPVAHGAPTLLVATPVGELHEIGALMVVAEATTEGWAVVYLGADLPADQIAAAARHTNARAVALGAVYAPRTPRLADEVAALRSALPADVALLLGGAAMEGVEAPAREGRTVFVADLDGLRRELRSLA